MGVELQATLVSFVDRYKGDGFANATGGQYVECSDFEVARGAASAKQGYGERKQRCGKLGFVLAHDVTLQELGRFLKHACGVRVFS
jgi:hypothetical protein